MYPCPFFFFVLVFSFLKFFGERNSPLILVEFSIKSFISFFNVCNGWGNRPQRDLFQMRHYKLPALLVGGEKDLHTKKMRWILYHLTSSIVYDYFHSITSLQHCMLQVFLDIVESVNLLMSSKGEL